MFGSLCLVGRLNLYFCISEVRNKKDVFFASGSPRHTLGPVKKLDCIQQVKISQI
jgi:hypothetical protein